MNHIIHITGNIVIYTFLTGILILLLECIWYSIPKKEKRADPAKTIALITGASSGLGREYAQLVDRRLKDVDEIWLVGRRISKLKDTASVLTHSAKCIQMDLTETAEISGLKTIFANENISVRCLINCAGFGKVGSSGDISISTQAEMININCIAPAALANTCIPFMNSGSMLVNICSTAGFQPLQYLNTYASSKSFLLRYTRALRRELLPKQIRVSAVCPYWIKDTEFITTATADAGSGIKRFPLSSNVKSVSHFSFFWARIGIPVITPGIICSLHRMFSKLIPDTVLIYIWDAIRHL